MKKIDTSNIVANVRKLGAAKATLDHLQESIQESLAAVFKGVTSSLTDPVILYGCVNSGAGQHFIISSGAIMLNGEYYDIDAADFTAAGGETAVLSLVTTYRGTDPALYSDGVRINTHSIRKLFWSGAVSGAGLGDFGDCVAMVDALPGLSTKVNKSGDTMSGILDMGGNKITGIPTPVHPFFAPTAPTNVATNKDYADSFLRRDIYSPSGAYNVMSVPIHMGSNQLKNVGDPTANTDAARLADVTFYVNAEASTRATNDGTLQTNITNEANARIAADSALDSAKANRVQSAWVNITVINGWNDFGTPPQYRIDQFGQVHLRGYLDGNLASSDVFGVIVGMTTAFTRLIGDDSATVFANLMMSAGSGNIAITPRGTGLWLIDGVAIWLD